MSAFSTVFLSVFVGALPFLLIAVLTSGFIEVFLSRETLAKILPKHPLAAVVAVPLLGFVLPLCECGVIPVAGRLVRKGVPLSVALAFMLSNPILNPFPLLSTRTAFSFFPAMVPWRMAAAYAVAVTIGLIVMLMARLDPGTFAVRQYTGGGLWGILENNPQASAAGFGERLLDALAHASLEFFNVGRFFILGSLAAAAVQVFVPQEALLQLAEHHLAAVAGMMGFAFVVSICSEADAFVAAGFLGTFPPGALLAFLVFGPMVDIKNTMMMLAAFPKAVVLRLVILIAALTLLAGMAANHWM